MPTQSTIFSYQHFNPDLTFFIKLTMQMHRQNNSNLKIFNVCLAPFAFTYIPEDPDKLSFAKQFLEMLNFDKFVKEIRTLGKSVVLHKYLRNEDERPGTVYVFDVNAKCTGSQVVIEMKVIYTT